MENDNPKPTEKVTTERGITVLRLVSRRDLAASRASASARPQRPQGRASHEHEDDDPGPSAA
jgi:hypothetical protein